MTVALDNAYRSQRLRLAATVSVASARAFDRLHEDRDRTLATVIPLVVASQGRVVALVDAYLAAKTVEAGGDGRPKGLDPERYTIQALRGITAGEVYGRTFGALAGQLGQGVDEAVARASARAALDRLVRTDMQLSQTHASRDWMADEPRVVGYRRVLGPGKNCALCERAATRTYRVADLMPIHERCSCSVAPLFGKEAVASVGTTVRVEDDPELGPRLMADEWSDVGPRL